MNENEQKLLQIFQEILENQKNQIKLLEEMKKEIHENKKSTKEIESISNWFFFFYIIIPTVFFIGSVALGFSIIKMFL